MINNDIELWLKLAPLLYSISDEYSSYLSISNAIKRISTGEKPRGMNDLWKDRMLRHYETKRDEKKQKIINILNEIRGIV